MYSKQVDSSVLHLFIGIFNKDAFYKVLICPSRVPEMSSLKVTDKGLEIGAAVTLTDLSKKLEEVINSMPGNFNTSPSYTF